MHKYNLPRPYLSASAIGTLQTCPKQYEFRYIHGLVIPPGAALVTGSALHKTFETYYTDAMHGSSERLTGKQVAEMSVACLDEVLDSQETNISKAEYNDVTKNVMNLSEVYVDTVGQNINPIAVEEEVRYTSACGVDILAYIDLVRELPEELRDGEFDTQGICDYKITTRKWDLKKLQNSLQFNLYSMITGIGNIEIHNMVKDTKATTRYGKSKMPVDGVLDLANNLRVVTNRFDGSQCDHMEALIESAARLISSGIFMPCALDAWCCNETWCGYWSLCRGGGQCGVKYVDMKSAQESSTTENAPAEPVL